MRGMIAVHCSGAEDCRGAGGVTGRPAGTGCEERQVSPSEPAPGYALTFTTADLSTRNRAASLRLYDQGLPVNSDILNTIATSVTVATWPDGDPVAATLTTGAEPGGQLPGGGQIQPYNQVDVQLDDSVVGSAWYAVSIRTLPPDRGG